MKKNTKVKFDNFVVNQGVYSPQDAYNFCKMVLQQLHHQNDSRGRLHTKIGTLLGFEFVLVALLLNVLRGYPWETALPSLSCMFVSWVFLVVAFRARGWVTVPNVDRVCEHINLGHNMMTVLMDTIDGTTNAYGSNARILAFMGRMLNWAIVLIGFGIALAAFVVFRDPSVHLVGFHG